MQRTITSPEDIEDLFPENLIPTFRYPFSNSENNLIQHVSLLLAQYQHDTDGQFQILLQAISIDLFNQKIHYWIIKTAYEIKLANNDKFKTFLINLIPCIPHSPFLWFYLQQTIGKKPLENLFEIYHPENINEMIKKIDKDFAKKYLASHGQINISEIQDACISYAIGEYTKTYVLTTKIINNNNPRLHVSQAEKDLAYCLVGGSFQKISTNPEIMNHLLPKSGTRKNNLMSIEYVKNNFKQVLSLYDEIMNDSKNLSPYSESEINEIHALAGRSYEQTGEKIQALALYEKIYPKMIHHPGKNAGITQLVFMSMTSVISGLDKCLLQTKKKSLSIQSNLYQSADILKNEGIKRRTKVDRTEKDYKIAIKALNKALELYIRDTKELLSENCAECYSELASCFLELGDLDLAYVKCSMAYAISTQVTIKIKDVLIIEEKLRGIELKQAIRDHGKYSTECAKAHENLGLVLEIRNDRDEASDEYQACLEIYEKVYGKNDSRTQKIAEKLEVCQKLKTIII